VEAKLADRDAAGIGLAVLSNGFVAVRAGPRHH
jgi:hypothetical protein